EGDANNDSLYSQTQDEFIEFVNIGSNPLNVSGYQIIDDTNTKAVVYTIPNGTIIPAGGALVVFGGGNPRGLFGG
ncbi:lamin tail domain-containing protein, partial [Umezakia ovalisporum]|uniref:lamin tail domain-containing protein n=1 Tax=Umezakia ovalisporum TaxID=75695 RepID=UPI0039C64CA4